jgi:glycosyltransferase involved in cell wall biosynthesis
MASRRPVIATRVGGIPEIIEDGVTGTLVASEDQDALTAAIRGLIENSEKRMRLTSAAYDFVRLNYSLKNMCDSYQCLYADVLKNQRRETIHDN